MDKDKGFEEFYKWMQKEYDGFERIEAWYEPFTMLYLLGKDFYLDWSNEFDSVTAKDCIISEAFENCYRELMDAEVSGDHFHLHQKHWFGIAVLQWMKDREQMQWLWDKLYKFEYKGEMTSELG